MNVNLEPRGFFKTCPPSVHPVKAALNVLVFVAFVAAGFVAAIAAGAGLGLLAVLCSLKQLGDVARQAITDRRNMGKELFPMRGNQRWKQ
jgi:hypothetical protein